MTRMTFNFPNGMGDVELDTARAILDTIEQAITEKVDGDPYKLTKDHIRVGLVKLSDFGRGSPTRFTFDIIRQVKRQFPETAEQANRLIKLYDLSQASIECLMNQHRPNWQRHLCVESESADPFKVAQIIIAIAKSHLDGGELQDKVPLCVTDFLGVNRLSIPQVIGFGVIMGAMLCGASLSKPNKACKRIVNAVKTSPETVKELIGLFVPSPGIAHKIQANKYNTGYRSVLYNPRYIGDLRNVLKDSTVFYELISNSEMINAIENGYATHNKGVATQIRLYLEAVDRRESLSSIHLRDIANSLYVSEQYKEYLPDGHFSLSFARTLGVERQQKSGRKKQVQESTGESSRVSTVDSYDMYVLAEFESINKIEVVWTQIEKLNGKEKQALLVRLSNSATF